MINEAGHNIMVVTISEFRSFWMNLDKSIVISYKCMTTVTSINTTVPAPSIQLITRQVLNFEL